MISRIQLILSIIHGLLLAAIASTIEIVYNVHIDSIVCWLQLSCDSDLIVPQFPKQCSHL
jgi:hypothetical protein